MRPPRGWSSLGELTSPKCPWGWFGRKLARGNGPIVACGSKVDNGQWPNPTRVQSKGGPESALLWELVVLPSRLGLTKLVFSNSSSVYQDDE
jgi:hypothetical protein